MGTKMKLTLTIITTLLCALPAFGQSAGGGIELYEKGDYNGAITILQNVVQTDKKNRDAWLFLGMSFARTGKNTEALKALRKGASISSKNSSGYDKTIKIISKPRASFTETARRNLTTGTVRLVVEFGADGQVKAVIPIESLPNGLTESCMEAARNIKFEPAYKNGKPVTYISIIDNYFDIQ